MDQLVEAHTSIATKMGPSTSGASTDRFIIRQSHAKDLPAFSGRAEEWLAFLSKYERTTTVCGFTDDENLLRLQRCLKGEALKAVQSPSLTIQPVYSNGHVEGGVWIAQRNHRGDDLQSKGDPINPRRQSGFPN
jgi:hypothetical protein